jgi:hypothetical protein
MPIIIAPRRLGLIKPWYQKSFFYVFGFVNAIFQVNNGKKMLH